MLRRYGPTNPPTQEDGAEWYNDGLEAGLTEGAAYAYALLMFWGAWYGYQPLAIVSGRRSVVKQTVMRIRYALGEREGFAAKPAASSSHTRGEGFDLTRSADLPIFGQIAPHVGLRWGGNFSDPDPVHFDTGR